MQKIAGSLGTALIVEDEPFVAMVVHQSLEDEGFTAITAGTGADGIAQARALLSGTGLALAIVDVGLPDMRGDEVVIQLRDMAPALPVIVSTGFTTEDLEMQFARSIAVTLLAKPFDGQTLRATLQGLGFPV